MKHQVCGKIWHFFIALFAIPFFLVGCAQNEAVPIQTIGESGYVLDSGDSLRILIYGQDELSGEFTIDPSGQISLPLIKEIKASGMTVRQLEEAITNELHPKYLNDPRVSVEVLAYRSVYILGEVRAPGKYAYVPNMTVLQGVAVAGGHTYRANENNAEITRLDGKMLRTFKVPMTYMVQPGDTLIITRRWF